MKASGKGNKDPEVVEAVKVLKELKAAAASAPAPVVAAAPKKEEKKKDNV